MCVGIGSCEYRDEHAAQAPDYVPNRIPNESHDTYVVRLAAWERTRADRVRVVEPEPPAVPAWVTLPLAIVGIGGGCAAVAVGVLMAMRELTVGD